MTFPRKAGGAQNVIKIASAVKEKDGVCATGAR